MKTLKLLVAAAAMSGLVLGLGACEQKGTMEKAGEKTDEMLESAGDKMKDAADATSEAAEETKEKLEDMKK